MSAVSEKSLRLLSRASALSASLFASALLSPSALSVVLWSASALISESASGSESALVDGLFGASALLPPVVLAAAPFALESVSVSDAVSGVSGVLSVSVLLSEDSSS